MHILGYLIDYDYQELRLRLAKLQEFRVERVYHMVDKLKTRGVVLEPEKIFALAQKGTVGRLHVARALAEEGLVSSVKDAFDRYIGDGKPAHVLGFKFSPEEAVGLIRRAGGIPILAHPYMLSHGGLIRELVAQGIRGLEVFYPEHSASMRTAFFALAKEYGLLITGGSDFHGSAKPEVALGCIKLEYSFVEELKNAREVINAK